MAFRGVGRPAVVVTTLLLTGALAGCGNSPTQVAAEQPSPSTPATPVASTTTAAPTPDPTTTDPSTPDPADTAATADLASQLLTGDELPGLNAAFTWTDGETAPGDDKAFGACQKFDFLSIGATEVIQRDFAAPTGVDANAAEQIAVFPDAMNTHRAGAVLTAWHRQCAAHIGRLTKDPKIGQLTDVPVTSGTGSWYLVTLGPSEGIGDQGRFSATGIVVSGTQIALLQMNNAGQDYNYAAGKEPMVGAVQAAAKKLGPVAE
jgi:hypothetical protein